ncbi:MAG: hypothetical protein ACTSR2_15395, partial [Candidatus Hodarchaeales archaeon]
PVQIIDVKDFTSWYWANRPDFEPIRHKHFWGIFKALPRIKQRTFIVRKLLLSASKSELHQSTFHNFLEERTDDPQIFQFFNAITGFALSLNIRDISTPAMFRFLKRLHERGKPGVPVGGCKHVVNLLTDFIKRNDSILQNNLELTKLEVDGGQIETAICRNLLSEDEIEIKAKHFILNLGFPQVNKIFKNSGISSRLPVVPTAIGGGFIFKSDKTILKRSTVAQFPSLRYVKGAVEPTLSSPDLAPNGMTMFVTHQIFHSGNVVKETTSALDEILETFPYLEEEDQLCAHTFHKGWPVNFAAQGNDLPNESEDFSNLFFVGDAYKGNAGWMMTEGVAHGVNKVVEKILF